MPLVQLLEQRFGLPVHMENDIHYKAYGYYKKEGREDDIVTLCFFPANVLPGTASVYHGTVLKGNNQFAGMVGFLPYLDVEQRNQGLEYAYPITIGDNVWIGAGVTVLPGVTIGNNAVIGAGSVVNRDIPDGVVAAGNPCRVIRRITDADREKYKIRHC